MMMGDLRLFDHHRLTDTIRLEGRRAPSALAASIVLGVLTAAFSTGCYRSSYQERNGPDLQRVPIDQNQPTSSVRWSTFWGLKQDTWAPVTCLEVDEQGTCKTQAPLCDEGAGQVSAGTVWYSVPVVLLTLGIAMPFELVAYCATDRPSSAPPPVGP